MAHIATVRCAVLARQIVVSSLTRTPTRSRCGVAGACPCSGKLLRPELRRRRRRLRRTVPGGCSRTASEVGAVAKLRPVGPSQLHAEAGRTPRPSAPRHRTSPASPADRSGSRDWLVRSGRGGVYGDAEQRTGRVRVTGCRRGSPTPRAFRVGPVQIFENDQAAFRSGHGAQQPEEAFSQEQRRDVRRGTRRLPPLGNEAGEGASERPQFRDFWRR